MNNVTPIRSDLNGWDIWPGAAEINRAGARLAQGLLIELENYSEGSSVAYYCCLEDWLREGRPFRNVVAEYAAKALVVGPEVLEGFYAVLSDFISIARTGSVPYTEKYDRWTGGAGD